MMSEQKLTERDLDVLRALAEYEHNLPNCGARPLDLGGHSGSYHSPSYRYFLTDLGRYSIPSSPCPIGGAHEREIVMIQIQIVLDFKGDNNNRLDLNILEREDANDQERELARQIEALHLSIMEEFKKQMPDEVEITRIG